MYGKIGGKFVIIVLIGDEDIRFRYQIGRFIQVAMKLKLILCKECSQKATILGWKHACPITALSVQSILGTLTVILSNCRHWLKEQFKKRLREKYARHWIAGRKEKLFNQVCLAVGGLFFR
jgi:hypothetical protein